MKLRPNNIFLFCPHNAEVRNIRITNDKRTVNITRSWKQMDGLPSAIQIPNIVDPKYLYMREMNGL